MSLLGSPDTPAQVYLSLTEHTGSPACGTIWSIQDETRIVTHQLQVQTRKALAGADIEIVSPALILVRDPAELTWKEAA